MGSSGTEYFEPESFFFFFQPSYISQHDFPAGRPEIVIYNSIGSPEQHGRLTSGQSHTCPHVQAATGQRTAMEQVNSLV